MLQVSVDDAHAVNVLAEVGDARHERTVATYHDVYLHSSLGSLIEFSHHVGIGDVVDFHLHPGLLALVGILDFRIQHSEDAALHGVRRNEQFVETERRERTVDEVEHLSHLIHDFRTCRHQQIVSIDPGISLVEVTRSDAGDIALLGFDIEQFGVNLQSLHAEDDVDAFLLHALAPLDVALLVEAGQEFHHGSYLLAVACRSNQGLHHLGVLGQTIECSLDGFHLRLDGSLAQHTDVAVETVVRHVDITVFLTDLVENALVGEELRFHDRRPLLIFQFLVSAVRERHQVLVVLVSSARKRSIKFLGVQPFAQFLLQVLRHFAVVDDAHRFALLTAVYTQGNLLHRTEVSIIVHLHFRILGKLEGISTVRTLLETEEN